MESSLGFKKGRQYGTGRAVRRECPELPTLAVALFDIRGPFNKKSPGGSRGRSISFQEDGATIYFDSEQLVGLHTQVLSFVKAGLPIKLIDDEVHVAVICHR